MTQRTWRSPWRIPQDPSPQPAIEDLASRIAWKAAWRARGFGNALGRGLARTPGGEAQRAVLARLDWWLLAGESFRKCMDDLGVADSEAQVLGRLALEPLPAIESWAETGIADFLMGRALDFGFEGLEGTSSTALALARDRAGTPPPSFGAEVVSELASDEPNRPCLQILIDRWMPAGARAFGRRSVADDAMLGSLVPGRDAALMKWITEAAKVLEKQGLEFTDGQRAGVELPGRWMRAGKRRSHDD